MAVTNTLSAEDIRREVKRRLEVVRSAKDEYERLEAALRALETVETPGNPGHRSRAPITRRPRGANREAILNVVKDAPGIATPELAAMSGLPKTVVYSTVREMVKKGILETEDLPDGRKGYRIPQVQAMHVQTVGTPERELEGREVAYTTQEG